LPANGPGRAVNGNFSLTNLRIAAAPAGDPDAGAGVSLRRAVADHEQETHGGWPVAAAIDGDPHTGWSIDPAEGAPHAALLETDVPVGSPGGTVLTIELGQGERQHSLGRFRLWATSVESPELPKGYGRAAWRIRGQAPASKGGGLLVVTVEIVRDDEPAPLSNVGSHFLGEGTFGGTLARFESVLGERTYPSSWQAWRVRLPADSAATPFELRVASALGTAYALRFRAHFIAGG